MSIPRDYAMTSEWTRVLLGSFQFSTSFYNGTNEVVYISISDSPNINSSFELAVGEYFNTPTPVFSAYAQGSNTSTGALVVSSFSGINLIDVVLQDGGAWFDNDPWYDEAFAYDGVSFAIPIFQTDRIDIQITGSRMDITGDSVAQRFVTSNPVIDTATGSVFVFQFDTDMDSQDNPLIRMHSTTGFLGPPMDDYLEFNPSITRFLSNLINGGKVQDATTTGTFSGTIVIDTDSKTMGLYRESTGGDNGDLIEQFTYDQQGSLTNTFLHLGVYCTTTADAGNYFEFFLDKTLMPYSLTASDLGIKLAANPDWLQVGEEEEEAESRYFYRLHGDLTSSDAVIETYERLIPDPSVDDFFIGFELVGDIPTDPSYVVSQNFSLDVADREFYIYVSGGLFTFQIGVGGVAFTTGQIVEEGAFKLSFIGTTYTILRDGVQVETGTFVRGSGIEPTATFVIGARHHTNLNAYTFVYDGIIANVNVNGTNFYAIDDNDANLVDSVGGKDAFIRNEVPSNWSLL